MSSVEQTPAGRTGPSSSKKIRMTMACERCRSKKVKCDFAHPSCTRCQQAKAQCSYDGSATQVDLFNLVKLNETVERLQQRVQSIETDMKDVSSNTQYVADEFRMTRGTADSLVATTTTTSSSNHPQQWSLSLTPRGLRIDTNIISLHDLYDILSTGISRLDLDNSKCDSSEVSSTSSSTTSTHNTTHTAHTNADIDKNTTIVRKKKLWKTKLKTFPLYSTWETHAASPPPTAIPSHASIHTSSAAGTTDLPLSREQLDHVMDIYEECLLCLPCPGIATSVPARYRNGTLDPMLFNAAVAWTARHAAIYHDLFPGQDPNDVGETFFEKAKEHLKDRFFKPASPDTMHSLLIMYIYATGRPNQVESEAYMYLGLAIRMCLDLNMYQESTDPDPVVRESNRRFFWAVYFLETLCTIHSDRPFALPAEDLITVGFPTVMDHEASGEKRWRVLFTTQRFRITRIYRNIMHKAAQEKPLLSSISTLDRELKDWYEQLPPEFKYTPGDKETRDWATASFREQACIKLNFEYNFQLCQLYSLFSSRAQPQELSAVELLCKQVCQRAADNIVDLLECYSRLQQRWCHFSLENLMVATIVFAHNKKIGDDKEEAWAQKQLQRMAELLSRSPVCHHKYVFSLVGRIQKILSEDADLVDLDQDETGGSDDAEQSGGSKYKRSAEDLADTADTMSAAAVRQEQEQQEQPQTQAQTQSHSLPHAPQPLQSMLGMDTTAFHDLGKTDTVPFSDFLYTPTMIGYTPSAAGGLLQQQQQQHTQPHPPQQTSFSSPFVTSSSIQSLANPTVYSPSPSTPSPMFRPHQAAAWPPHSQPTPSQAASVIPTPSVVAPSMAPSQHDQFAQYPIKYDLLSPQHQQAPQQPPLQQHYPTSPMYHHSHSQDKPPQPNHQTFGYFR
ncbi:hypothetical protein BCR43DRAFT_527417 [Syncephalastrum racemosum]|uniref:Zn(2)-C6 fungal-type domain-containing protein n=1 Tax=Syncephalastrum racemosum TaxID=13706 RepID=A0A1X2H2Y2_SYNRA|nr:hypothetical protein BCR43DRAFT_527417 [Syncephalastrum racemosum]